MVVKVLHYGLAEVETGLLQHKFDVQTNCLPLADR